MTRGIWTGSPTYCPATGSRPSRSAPIPTARASSSPRWSGAGEPPARRPATPCCAVHGYTDYFFNTELADHFAARGFAFYALDLRKCGRSRRRGPDPALHHRPGQLRRGAGARAESSPPTPRRNGAACTAHSAGGLIVTAVAGPAAPARRAPRDAHRRRWCSTARVFDLHGPGDPAHRGDVGGTGRAGPAAQAARSSASRHQGGYGTTPAPRLRRRVRLQPGLEAARRVPRDVRLDQRDPARACAAAPRARRRRAQPDPAVGPQRRRSHPIPSRSSAATPCSTSRRSPGGPAASATAPPIVPITDAKHDVFLSLAEPRAAAYRELDGWLDWYLLTENTGPTTRTIRNRTDTHGALRPDDHRNRLGQQHSRRALRRQAGGDLRAGHVRRHLPQRRLHPDQDVRLRRRGRPDHPRQLAITASTRTSTRCAGPTSCRGSSAASTRSRGRRGLPALHDRTSRCTPATPGSDPRSPTAATPAHRGRRRVHRRPGGDRRRLARHRAAGHRRMRCRLLHQRQHHADRRRCPSTW